MSCICRIHVLRLSLPNILITRGCWLLQPISDFCVNLFDFIPFDSYSTWRWFRTLSLNRSSLIVRPHQSAPVHQRWGGHLDTNLSDLHREVYYFQTAQTPTCSTDLWVNCVLESKWQSSGILLRCHYYALFVGYSRRCIPYSYWQDCSNQISLYCIGCSAEWLENKKHGAK